VYSQQWRDLRRRERLYWIAAFLFVPAVAATLVLAFARLVGDLPKDYGGLWPLGIWLAAFVLANLYRRRFRCPRCHEHFFARKEGLPQDHEQCAACGLSLEPEEEAIGSDLPIEIIPGPRAMSKLLNLMRAGSPSTRDR
jgi:hypothetical protein